MSEIIKGNRPASMPNDFRLTLTSGTAVPTTDVTGATTIYATPYTGNWISLYNGTNWVNYASAEFSLAIGTLTNAKLYDVFCYANSSGIPTLEFLVWTNDTTRATAIAYQNGIAVKSGDTTRRYMGTFYTTAATTTEDSENNRYLWNMNNRVGRKMYKDNGATGTWTYTTAVFRQANADATYQLNFIIGLSEDIVVAQGTVESSNTTAIVRRISGLGLDSTTTTEGTSVFTRDGQTPGTGQCSHLTVYSGFPGVGKHYIALLEFSVATGTTSWLIATSGLTGIINA